MPSPPAALFVLPFPVPQAGPNCYNKGFTPSWNSSIHDSGGEMKIEPLEKELAAESIRPIYEGMEKKAGRVLNMYKVMAHKPNVLAPFLDFYKAVWAPGALDPKIKELAYLRTDRKSTRLNSSHL